MQITLEEKRIIYRGRPGTVTVWVELTSRRTFTGDGGPVMSLSEFLKRDDFTGLTFHNLFTGETIDLSRQTLLQLFEGFDFSDSLVAVTFNFVPDPGYGVGLQDDIQNDMRRSGRLLSQGLSGSYCSLPVTPPQVNDKAD